MFRKSFPIIFLILLLIPFLFLINIQPVKAVDIWRTTIYIKADGNIEPSNASIQRNNNIYTLTSNIANRSHPAFWDVIRIEKDNIILDGAGHTIDMGSTDVGESFDGIILEGRNNVTLQNLRMIGGRSCVRISNCSQITLINNFLYSDFTGCTLTDSINCSIIGNYIPGGSIGALRIGNSSNNLIVENSMNNLEGWGISLSSNDSIYHNNFDKRSGAADPRCSFWTGKGFLDNGYPSGGNYWRFINNSVLYYPVDIYHGLYQNISGSDGIGDVPYSMFFSIDNSTLIDRYPLMAPYTRFNITLNANTQPFFVGIISNSSLNNFIVNEVTKTISFNVNGTDNTVGFCRLYLPNDLIQNLWNNNYKILVDGQEINFTNNFDTQNTYIYLNYTHSTHTITIIPTIIVPEFSSLALMIILVTITSIVFFVEKKHVRKTK